jgi:hypothetical protein
MGETHPSRLLRAFQAVSICVVLALTLTSQTAFAQSYVRGFHNHNSDMKAAQPSWMTPLVMTTPLLAQFVREQFVRQRMPGGDPVWNIGNGKGPSLIVSPRVEADLAIPNYVVHGAAPGTDGVGDFCFTTRYRIASGNKQHGNYSVAAVASQTWTTGLAKNGAVSWTRGVTLAAGKAFGRFAVLSSIGATLPASSGLSTLGRPVAWNTAIEMHATTKIWVETESDATFYLGGTHDGKKQNFVTPGVFLCPMRPWNERSKSYFLLGVGMQFATTQYHASDHNLIVETKLYF